MPAAGIGIRAGAWEMGEEFVHGCGFAGTVAGLGNEEKTARHRRYQIPEDNRELRR